MNETINSYGGYRKTLSFGFVCLIYHATEKFCEKNFSIKNDALGKKAAQMIGAARSARQNIVEGSSRAATSKETEFRLYDVAKGFLEELAGDYEAFLVGNDSIPWADESPEKISVQAITLNRYSGLLNRHDYCKYLLIMSERFSTYIENNDPIIASNSILVLIDQACKLLHHQMVSIKKENINMQDKILNKIDQSGDFGKAPLCPKCGSFMLLRTAKKGNNQGNKFWSCSKFPLCDGIMEV
jgi:hypothetical protein